MHRHNTSIAAGWLRFLALSCLLLLNANLVAAQQAPALRLGVQGASPPFSYFDADGKLRGFDIEIAAALCAAMSVDCDYVVSDWDSMISGLRDRKYDAIVASMSITQERLELVDFSNRYYDSPARFVGPADAVVEFTNEGLRDRVVGVKRATTFDSYLTGNYRGVVDLRRYSNQEEALLDLLLGRLDLVLGDRIVLAVSFLETDLGRGYAFLGPDLNDPRWFGEGAGIAVRKGDDALRQAFNQAIDTIRADGSYESIRARYFDFDIYNTGG